MALHVLDFNSDAYAGAHITYGQPGSGESVLCLHFLGDNTAAEVLKTLALAIFETPASPPVHDQQPVFDDQPPPAWEDTFPKQQSFAGVDPEVSSVVRALDADAQPPEPLPDGPLVSGADVPSMKEMLELMQGKFGPGVDQKGTL